jgi:hypothetical protein
VKLVSGCEPRVDVFSSADGRHLVGIERRYEGKVGWTIFRASDGATVTRFNALPAESSALVYVAGDLLLAVVVQPAIGASDELRAYLPLGPRLALEGHARSAQPTSATVSARRRGPRRCVELMNPPVERGAEPDVLSEVSGAGWFASPLIPAVRVDAFLKAELHARGAL